MARLGPATIGPRTLVIIDEAGQAGTIELADRGRVHHRPRRHRPAHRRRPAARRGRRRRRPARPRSTPSAPPPSPRSAGSPTTPKPPPPSPYARATRPRWGSTPTTTASTSATSAPSPTRPTTPGPPTGAGLDSILLAPTRDLVTQLNARARADRTPSPYSPTPDPSGPGHALEVHLADGNRASVGDVIVTRRNDRRLVTSATDWVKNGDRWTITAVHPDHSLTARHHDARRIASAARRLRRRARPARLRHHRPRRPGHDHRHLPHRRHRRRDPAAALRRPLPRPQATTSTSPTAHDGDPHSLIRPETLLPPTAIDVLTTHPGTRRLPALRHHHPARDLDSAATQLHEAALRYHDALGYAAEQTLGPRDPHRPRNPDSRPLARTHPRTGLPHPARPPRPARPRRPRPADPPDRRGQHPPRRLILRSGRRPRLAPQAAPTGTTGGPLPWLTPHPTAPAAEPGMAHLPAHPRRPGALPRRRRPRDADADGPPHKHHPGPRDLTSPSAQTCEATSPSGEPPSTSPTPTCDPPDQHLPAADAAAAPAPARPAPPRRAPSAAADPGLGISPDHPRRRHLRPRLRRARYATSGPQSRRSRCPPPAEQSPQGATATARGVRRLRPVVARRATPRPRRPSGFGTATVHAAPHLGASPRRPARHRDRRAGHGRRRLARPRRRHPRPPARMDRRTAHRRRHRPATRDSATTSRPNTLHCARLAGRHHDRPTARRARALERPSRVLPPAPALPAKTSSVPLETHLRQPRHHPRPNHRAQPPGPGLLHRHVPRSWAPAYLHERLGTDLDRGPSLRCRLRAARTDQPDPSPPPPTGHRRRAPPGRSRTPHRGRTALDAFRDRLVFPIYSGRDLVGFIARTQPHQRTTPTTPDPSTSTPAPPPPSTRASSSSASPKQRPALDAGAPRSWSKDLSTPSPSPSPEADTPGSPHSARPSPTHKQTNSPSSPTEPRPHHRRDRRRPRGMDRSPESVLATHVHSAQTPST